MELSSFDSQAARLALALALGLLVGVERERRKEERGNGGIAGLRTFGLTGLFGGLCAYVTVPHAVLSGTLVVGAMVVVAYALDPERERDRGLTTEIALLVTYVLGALALTHPSIAAGATFAATALLSFRAPLHRFVLESVTEAELRDGLFVLIFAFIVLPLAPDVDLGPYAAVNPQRIARVVLVVILISAGGYVAQRMLGKRYGLLVSGFAAGFVSSSATIGAMGRRAKLDPAARNAAVAAGLASSIATVIFYAAVVATVDVALLPHLALPLGLALVAALLGTVVFARAKGPIGSDAPKGRAFEWVPALLVGGASGVLAIASAALAERFGGASVVVVSAVAGFVDAHATTASVGTLRHGGHLGDETARLAIVAALSSNTVTKIIMASLARDRAYALRIAVGVLAIAGAAWLGLVIAGL